MQKEYTTPVAEIIEIKVEDVMTGSDFGLPEIPVGGLKPYKFD